MRRWRGAAGTAGTVLGVLLLAGCTAAPVPAPTATATVTATATASSSASPSPGATPTASDASTSAAGCPATGGSIPAGADRATIPDVDGDGRADVEFYAEQPRFEFGVRTASGAVIVLADDLAGPATHSGWIRKGPSGPPLALMDDNRSASMHALVGCRFVTPDGSDGRPYRFALNGFGDAGTGVTCTPAQGGSWLSGVLAKRRPGGRYDITRTRILVSADGRTARNGDSTTVATGLDPDDPRVRTAMTSVCPGVPKVHTSGR